MAASRPQQPSRSNCSARQHGNAVWTCKPALRGSVPIICPTLIIEAEHDFAGGGGQTLIDALTAPAQLVQLTEHQGADGHCGGLGQEIWSEVVYHWLRNTLLHDRAAVTGKEKEHDH